MVYKVNVPGVEDLLLRAIENGELDRVKQLIGSGIDLNTILHSATRFESTTILGTAAYEGQIKIMEYLLKLGVKINYRDPLCSRTALHWACMGGQYEAVKLLIDYKANVNCVDRDNMSPLISATVLGNVKIVLVLIYQGAMVLQKDRLRCSALHYASFLNWSHIVRILIEHGCVMNNKAIYGRGTPLANLVYHGNFENCKRLIEAGYDLSHDSWLAHIGTSENLLCSLNEHELNMLVTEYQNTKPLQRLCLKVIRKQFQGVKIEKKIGALPMPDTLKSYLSLNIC
ncbi:unnamed protein product [Owenia fusiformis]|uniref:SOCS box domain-containing protein n=1 Tax=Owenia fusiformis TaxID=6347 RepID=A0A8S4PRX1_OWEFU|nr:unnamed protein product [Owenia fusiformis]